MYLRNLDDKQKKGRQWVSLFIDIKTVVCTDSFEIEYTPEDLFSQRFYIKDKFIIHNIFRIESNDSVMCGFYCIAFIVYLFAGKLCWIIPLIFSSRIQVEWQHNI